MLASTGFLTFALPGYPEMAVLLVIGLLLFGRRLPEVGRTVGQTLLKIQRGIGDFKRQLEADESLREAKSAMSDIKKAVDAPRIATDPRRLLRKLTDEALATPKNPLSTASDKPPTTDETTVQQTTATSNPEDSECESAKDDSGS